MNSTQNVFPRRLMSLKCPKPAPFSKTSRTTLTRTPVFARLPTRMSQEIREPRRRKQENFGDFTKNYTKLLRITHNRRPSPTLELFPLLTPSPDLRGWVGREGGEGRGVLAFPLPSPTTRHKSPVWARKENLVGEAYVATKTSITPKEARDRKREGEKIHSYR